MEFKDGTSVYTSDGKVTGSLDRVDIDPGTKEITHIVIQKGFLTKEDKVIRLDNVASATQEKEALRCTIDEIKEMSSLDIEQYKPTSDSYW